MCDKCVEIDKTIERYRNILRSINDKKTIDGAEKLIAELEAKRSRFIRIEISEVAHWPIMEDPLIAPLL